MQLNMQNKAKMKILMYVNEKFKSKRQKKNMKTAGIGNINMLKYGGPKLMEEILSFCKYTL
jgi:hypothetical protein